MKLILFLLSVFLISCGNDSAQAKVYEDSAIYYSNKLSALTDSGYSQNDSIAIMQKNRAFIYKTMRQHYLDKMEEVK